MGKTRSYRECLGRSKRTSWTTWFKDPNKAFFTDENGVQQSYIDEIKTRADELKNKKIFSKQSGEQDVGGFFLPIESATTPSLLEPSE